MAINTSLQMSHNSPEPPQQSPLNQDKTRLRTVSYRTSYRTVLWLTAIAIGLVGPILLAAKSAQAQRPDPASEPVRYSVAFDHAANHYVIVEAHFPQASPEQELFLPVWTPGSYLVREYAQHIDSVEATSEGEDDTNSRLSIAKISKNRWKLSNTEVSAVTVRYRIYCNELTVRTNFVDSEFALLNGAATFLTTEDSRQLEHVVELKLPADWNSSVTSLERRVRLGAHAFVAESYDELVDSPFVVGNPTLHPFEVGGVQHYLVNQGGEGLWDGGQAASDVAKIVEVHQKMWGQVPYDRYYFLNVIAESGGGLEHDNSTVMLTSRWNFRDGMRYKSWLGLVSHEFFHTWNVRRLRPKALATYDYEGENYFGELWVAEGVTSYYDDLGLARAGHSNTKEYLAALSKQISTLETTDGRFKQSLTEASHDAWIKYYRPNENSRNTTISYYNKGAIVAFLLDAEIRRSTSNAKCLDDVMRGLYTKFALKEGYTTQDVIAEVNELTGSDWTEWFQHAIDSTDALDYQDALDWLGLKFAHQPEPKVEGEDTGDEPTEFSTEKKTDEKSTWTGIVTKYDAGKLIVSAVEESGPAFEAGFNVGDEIIAVNDYRVSDNLADRIDQFKDDGEVDVLLARRGALSSVKLVLEKRPVTDWKLELVAKPTESQKANLAAWLHQSNEPESSSEPQQDKKDSE
jgi:predicted metalloprotease with PDZ domain